LPRALAFGLIVGVLAAVTGGCGARQDDPVPPQVEQAVTSHAPAELRWETDWNRAFERARREGKPVLVNFYADWCVWCKHLETVTFRDQKVAALLADRVVPLGVNIDGDVQQLIRDHRIEAPPTIVVFDPAATKRLDAASLHMRTDHSPYADVTVTGWPVVTISGGVVVARDGEPADAEPGRGRYLRRRPRTL